MTETAAQKLGIPPAFPDHTQLPESDGTFVKNFQEHPQSILLTDSIEPVLQKLHPDGNYAIGQDCGIYWRETEPPERGAEAPDWFYVPNVPPLLLDGRIRRSYVLWREYTPPLIALEFASGDGREERDRTSLSAANLAKGQRPGKFWVYEKIIRMPYYGIFEIETGHLEVYHLTDFTYRQLEPNDRGHYPVSLLGAELGVWQGAYPGRENDRQTQWLRWWDLDGNLLLTGREQAAEDRDRAEKAEQRAKRLEERLRALGADPDIEL
ncbi:Uma2 family endonuclease [Oscillatoriales cyanobacterium LEGE 11467]|uniref:Uma2 family endonuclease n=1 Tax=Zarconia navalis LEGE 11467 TaxID=1828826 RepID=A0A928VWE8_9CYAN|nr:Uma2 family endonuclease [Zarconia navalis]MBE9039977.1 Uma2 family endonuclease [Zarconia navalis LEGE 11467]